MIPGRERPWIIILGKDAMEVEQRKALEKRYRAWEWHGRSRYRKHSPKQFNVETWQMRGWTLELMRRDDLLRPKVVHSVWRGEEATGEMIEIDAFACPSVAAAHDHLIEVLARVGSDGVERRSGKSAVGDVSFGLAGHIVLFARANLVMLVRNLGPAVPALEQVAQQVDKFIERAVDAQGRK